MAAVRSAVDRFGTKGPKFEIVSSLENAASTVQSAIVTGQPCRHAPVALTLLNAGLPVLVEKPIAIDRDAARRVVEAAARRSLPFAVSLPLSRASYLREFADRIRGRERSRLVIRWFDPPLETRYGETKAADLTLHIAHDMIPHLWSVLRALGIDHSEVLRVRAANGDVFADLKSDKTPIRLEFGRRSHARIRHVMVEFCDGRTAKLDFDREPGSAILDDRAIDVGSTWEIEQSPMVQVISEFLQVCTNAKAKLGDLEASACLDSTELASQIQDAFSQQEAHRLAVFLAEGRGLDHQEMVDLIVDNVVPEFAGAMHVTFLDRDRLNSLARMIYAEIAPKKVPPSPIDQASGWDREMIRSSKFIESVRLHLRSQNVPPSSILS
jgi:predicted dehydrogenase